jgi:phage I-like protein
MRDNDGLKVIVKKWCDSAANRLGNGEYRYMSPVLKIDPKTGHATRIHSVSITNNPALHGAQELVAANNNKDITMNNVKDKESFKEEEAKQDNKNEIDSFNEQIGTLKEYKKVIDEAKEYICDNIISLTDMAKTEEQINSIKAFSEDFFDNNIKDEENLALADISMVIQEKRENLNGNEMLEWINQRMQETIDEDEKEQLMIEKRRLEEFRASNPELWNRGFTIASQKIIDMVSGDIQNQAETEEQFKNIAEVVGFSDKGDNNVSLVSTITEIKEFNDKVKDFLKEEECESFSALHDKINNLTKEKEEAVLRNEAEISVFKAMNSKDCKITKAMEDWAIDYYVKNGKEAFNDYLSKAPVVFSKKPEFENFSKPNRKLKEFNATEMEQVKFLEKSFGITEDEAKETIRDVKKNNQ